MIINWLAEKAQQFLTAQDAGIDELSVNFDFALSAEIMGLLYAQNDDSDAGGTTSWMREVELRREQQSGATQGAVAEAALEDEASSVTLPYFALDEHELALA